MSTDTAPAKQEFRNYETGALVAAVREHYRKMRSRQTYDYVQRMKAKYLTFDRPMHLWDAMVELNKLVDVSDPDMDLPNVQHLLQSAEAMREQGCPDWMQLVGLIHDLGKVMYLWGSDEDGTSEAEQWGLVGDVFVVGAALPDTCVYPEFNALNPDMSDPRYNTELGVYEPGCGLDNLHLAWGHDEYLYQVLRNQISRLHRLTKDIRQAASRHEEDLDLTLDLAPLDIRRQVQLAADLARPQFQAKGVSVESSVDSLTRNVLGDEERLQQVLTNVLSNALQHTPAGGSVHLKAHNHGPTVEIVITDTGEGIEAGQLEAIFDRFHRADPARTIADSPTGSGLGLTIARRIVIEHHGSITATSPGPGQGSSFTIQLPAHE